MASAANLLTLKRPHTPDVASLFAPHARNVQPPSPVSIPQSPTCNYPRTPTELVALLGSCGLPLAASSRQFNDMMPTFMSVYEDKTEAIGDRDAPTPAKPQEQNGPYDLHAFHNLSPFSSFHQHRDSLSTSASGSADSSPTTTASLVDTPSATETPSTSPDTPASSHSESAYTSLALAMKVGPESKSELRMASTPPTKKARNLKNLAVNTSTPTNLGRAVSTANLPMDAPKPFQSGSGPFSPAFVKPAAAPPRRKSSAMGLTIKTPGPETAQERKFEFQVPPTPKLNRPATLRHIQSTPSLPMFSPRLQDTFGPSQFFPSNDPSNIPSAVPEQDESLPSRMPDYEPPLSQEAKPEAYPNGPICIYDPHVYLYFEPTAQEASQYDVIFNVASEVKNPFLSDDAARINSITLDMALEAMADRKNSTPSTPKASDINSGTVPNPSKLGPEYIHIPWEHNTDIVPDLYRVVKVIDDRVQKGLRVLIHCQCGVSRSASLVVAYGLFKNPGISVQDAYATVKARSQWIGPNMNLIMQLQEFRSGILRSNPTKASVISRPTKVLHGRSPVSTTRNDGLGKEDSSMEPQVPQTAPISENIKHVPTPIRTDHLDRVSPGPSSAPSDFSWTSANRDSDFEYTHKSVDRSADVPPATAVDQPARQMQSPPLKASQNRLAIKTDVWPVPTYPASTIAQQTAATMPLETPRSAEFAMSPIRPLDVEDSFGITSPRAGLFVPSPTEQLMDAVATSNSPPEAQFAMAPVRAPEPDLTFGLTSPRATSFSTQLPHRLLEQNTIPLIPQEPSQSSESRLARANIGSQIGMSTRSSSNLREAFLSSNPPPVPSLITASASPQIDADLDGLMSPRATEFTTNPFHEHFVGSQSKEDEHNAGDVTPTPDSSDPRSPAIKGASPITRSIFDVL